jgi:hypothetical protein
MRSTQAPPLRDAERRRLCRHDLPGSAVREYYTQSPFDGYAEKLSFVKELLMKAKQLLSTRTITRGALEHYGKLLGGLGIADESFFQPVPADGSEALVIEVCQNHLGTVCGLGQRGWCGWCVGLGVGLTRPPLSPTESLKP